jgi:hypothetical protein
MGVGPQTERISATGSIWQLENSGTNTPLSPERQQKPARHRAKPASAHQKLPDPRTAVPSASGAPIERAAKRCRDLTKRLLQPHASRPGDAVAATGAPMPHWVQEGVQKALFNSGNGPGSSKQHY